MSDHTEISWADSTWNVVIGCDKVSPGCDNCYAIRTAHRMQANPNPKVSSAYAGTEADGEWTGQINLIYRRLGLPLTWQRPRRIFVNAQSDLFHKDVPDHFIATVFAVMAVGARHTFQILTKRPGRMRSLLQSEDFRLSVAEASYAFNPSAYWKLDEIDWPLRNVWLGVSVEDQKRADLRIPLLLQTPAAIRFLSMEPLLGAVDLDTQPWRPIGEDLTRIDWVIVGGESGPGARPMHPDWARSLRDQCAAANIPFHLKQWGQWAPGSRDGRCAVVAIDGEVIEPAADLWQRQPQTDELSRRRWAYMHRTTKRRAGRELDGREWSEFPA